MEYKYLSKIPKPLLKDFVNDKVIPFVGAGFSKNADFPEGLSMIPDWNELGKLAADSIPDYQYDNNAVKALSQYEKDYTRARLIEFLMEALCFGQAKPGVVHKDLCELFSETICTTNFDTLIEDAMERPRYVITTKDALSIGSRQDRKIIKIHGDFSTPSQMVVTEDDYDRCLQKNSPFAIYVAGLFLTKTILLIGYSFGDPDIRTIWKLIYDQMNGMEYPIYSITVNASKEQVAKYENCKIQVINLGEKSQTYSMVLHEFFEELKDYKANAKADMAKSSDESINAQMIIPAEYNQLCFVSSKINQNPQLSVLLNSIFHSCGIVPVHIDDLAIYGDNDILRIVIGKSKAAILDVTDRFEFRLARTLKPKENILLLGEKTEKILLLENEYQLLTYRAKDLGKKEVGTFADEIKKWLHRIFSVETSTPENKESDTSFAKAYRLFEKKDYSACIISAYSELEYLISSRHTGDEGNRLIVLYKLLELISYMEEYPPNNIQDIYELIKVRDKILNQKYLATEKDAKDTLALAEAVNRKDLEGFG